MSSRFSHLPQILSELGFVSLVSLSRSAVQTLELLLAGNKIQTTLPRHSTVVFRSQDYNWIVDLRSQVFDHFRNGDLLRSKFLGSRPDLVFQIQYVGLHHR